MTSAPDFDVLTIGNAIVDAISQAKDAYREERKLVKGQRPEADLKALVREALV